MCRVEIYFNGFIAHLGTKMAALNIWIWKLTIQGQSHHHKHYGLTGSQCICRLATMGSVRAFEAGTSQLDTIPCEALSEHIHPYTQIQLWKAYHIIPSPRHISHHNKSNFKWHVMCQYCTLYLFGFVKKHRTMISNRS